MGGPGSGRHATKISVTDCRAIEIGELCDGGRLGSATRAV